VLGGLIGRRLTGEGQRVGVSMLATAIAINQWSTVAESGPDLPVGRQLQGHEWPRDHGFASRDGRCLIGFRQEVMWRRFIVAIGRVDLLDDPAFAHAVKFHPPLIATRVESTLRAWSMAALERLVRDELGGTLVPVLDLRRLVDHEQVRNLRIVDRSNGLRVSLPLSSAGGILEEMGRG
jgi:crotonobetainyl-CoA:carnitine CoA-transferase CaiB-like acyl-CoA transferase